MFYCKLELLFSTAQNDFNILSRIVGLIVFVHEVKCINISPAGDRNTSECSKGVKTASRASDCYYVNQSDLHISISGDWVSKWVPLPESSLCIIFLLLLLLQPIEAF